MTELQNTGAHEYRVLESREVFRGRVIAVRSDRVAMPGGAEAVRDVVEHPGAVAVVALDDAGRVVLIHQYRHPLRRHLWELPAGLLDVPGEPAWRTAARELYEEAHLAAGQWDVLADLNSSPGMSDEAIRVFLARGLSEVDDDRYAAEHEELDMTVVRVPLDEAVRRVLAGEINNAIAVSGLLAAARARDENWTPLRPSDTPWPDRPDH